MERLEFNGPISSEQKEVNLDFGNTVKTSKYAFNIETSERVVKAKAGCFCTSIDIQNKTSSANISGVIKMPAPNVTPFDVAKNITIHWENGGTTKVIINATVYDSQDSIQALREDVGDGGASTSD